MFEYVLLQVWLLTMPNVHSTICRTRCYLEDLSRNPLTLFDGLWCLNLEERRHNRTLIFLFHVPNLNESVIRTGNQYAFLCGMPIQTEHILQVSIYTELRLICFPKVPYVNDPITVSCSELLLSVRVELNEVHHIIIGSHSLHGYHTLVHLDIPQLNQSVCRSWDELGMVEWIPWQSILFGVFLIYDSIDKLWQKR